jgi:hypothetical protein
VRLSGFQEKQPAKRTENKIMKTIPIVLHRLLVGCILAGCLCVQNLNAQSPPGGGGGGGTNYYNPPPDISNYLKYKAQSFSVIDTNAAAESDTNLYNALLAFADDSSTDPTLQVLPFGDHCLLFKASHFDYSGETTRDFCLAVCDKLETPLYKIIDLSKPTNNIQNGGWLLQGWVTAQRVTDSMFLIVSNTSRIYNGFFRVIPYGGPSIELTGVSAGDTVSNTISFQVKINDLSGITNEQIAVLVDSLPARFSLGSSNFVNLDTRYAPNGSEFLSVIAENTSALIFDPQIGGTDNKLIYNTKTNLQLDFENPIYLTFAGDESSPDVGTNYSVFTISEPEYVTGKITDPSNGRVIKSYSGYVPYATSVAFAWNFNDTNGSAYAKDSYVFTFKANPSSSPFTSTKSQFGDNTTTLVITNGIGKQGVRQGGYCIRNYEEEDPSTTLGALVNSKQEMWGDTLEFLYRTLYYGQSGSIPEYSIADIGPNRSNPAFPHFPFAVNDATEFTWPLFLHAVLTNRIYSDFNYGPGHANGYFMGAGPKPAGQNYVNDTIGVDMVEPWVFGLNNTNKNWRMRKVAMWGCNTGNKSFTGGYHGWPEAFGIRTTGQQIHGWTKKNAGLFFLGDLAFLPYGSSHSTISEVAFSFDFIWIDGAVPFPGSCDPTYSFQFALETTLGTYPELVAAKPYLYGFPFLPYSSVYDDELMLNNISHVKTH